MDLAAKVQAMTIADNPGLLVPVVSAVQPPVPIPLAGTTAVSLSDSDSSSSASETGPPAEDAAAAKAAIEAARVAAQAATERMTMID